MYWFILANISIVLSILNQYLVTITTKRPLPRIQFSWFNWHCFTNMNDLKGKQNQVLCILRLRVFLYKMKLLSMAFFRRMHTFGINVCLFCIKDDSWEVSPYIEALPKCCKSILDVWLKDLDSRMMSESIDEEASERR